MNVFLVIKNLPAGRISIEDRAYEDETEANAVAARGPLLSVRMLTVIPSSSRTTGSGSAPATTG